MPVTRSLTTPAWRVFLLAVLLLVVAACGEASNPPTTSTSPEPPSTEGAPAEVEASLFDSWEVSAWFDSDLAVDLPSLISFELTADGRILGNGGCNSFSGSYTTVEDAGGFLLSASDLVHTEMFCEDASALEDAFFAALSGDGFFVAWDAGLMRWTHGGTALLVSHAAADHTDGGASGRDGLVDVDDPDAPSSDLPWQNPWFSEDMAGHWLLASLAASPEAGSLRIPDGGVVLEVSASGFGGRVCNFFGASISDDLFDPDEDVWPPLISRTLMLCEDESLNSFEEALVGALSEASAALFDGDQLVVRGERVELRFERIQASDAPGTVSPSNPGPDLGSGNEGSRGAEAFVEEVRRAMSDLSLREGVDVSEITVVSTVAQTWKDGSLGCPAPGMNYTQALVEGYLINLEVGGRVFAYHGAAGRPPFLCES